MADASKLKGVTVAELRWSGEMTPGNWIESERFYTEEKDEFGLKKILPALRFKVESNGV